MFLRRLAGALMRLVFDHGPRRYKKPYSLLTELEGLKRNVTKTRYRLSDLHEEWEASDAPCCPRCWSVEYRHLAEKQERRLRRARIVEDKLARKLPGGPLIPRTPLRLRPNRKYCGPDEEIHFFAELGHQFLVDVAKLEGLLNATGHTVSDKDVARAWFNHSCERQKPWSLVSGYTDRELVHFLMQHLEPVD